MTRQSLSAATTSTTGSSMTPPTLRKKYPTIGGCSTCTWLKSNSHLFSCKGTTCVPCNQHQERCNQFIPATSCSYPKGSWSNPLTLEDEENRKRGCKQHPIVISSCDEEDPMKPCNRPVQSVEVDDQIIYNIDDLLSESDQESETILYRPGDDQVLANVPKHEERWRRSTTPWHLEGLAAMSQQELTKEGNLCLWRMPYTHAPTSQAHVLGVQTLLGCRAGEFSSRTLKFPTDGILNHCWTVLRNWELNTASVVNYTRMEAFIITLTSTSSTREISDEPITSTLMDIIQTYALYGKHLSTYLITPGKTEILSRAQPNVQTPLKVLLLDRKLGDLCTLSNAQKRFMKLSVRLIHELQSYRSRRYLSSWTEKRSSLDDPRYAHMKIPQGWSSTGKITQNSDTGFLGHYQTERVGLDASPVRGGSTPENSKPKISFTFPGESKEDE